MALLDPYSGPARALNIALRTAHLAAMAVLTGGVAFGVPGAGAGNAAALTVATGAALLLSEMSHGQGWLKEGRGLLAILHVAVAAALFAAGHARAAAGTALVVGAVGSHLPKALRRWSLQRGSAGDPEGR